MSAEQGEPLPPAPETAPQETLSGKSEEDIIRQASTSSLNAEARPFKPKSVKSPMKFPPPPPYAPFAPPPFGFFPPPHLLAKLIPDVVVGKTPEKKEKTEGTEAEPEKAPTTPLIPPPKKVPRIILVFGLPFAGVSRLASDIARDQNCVHFSAEQVSEAHLSASVPAASKKSQKPWETIAMICSKLATVLNDLAKNERPRDVVIDMSFKNVEEFFYIHSVVHAAGYSVSAAIAVSAASDVIVLRAMELSKAFSSDDEDYVRAKILACSTTVNDIRALTEPVGLFHSIDNNGELKESLSKLRGVIAISRSSQPHELKPQTLSESVGVPFVTSGATFCSVLSYVMKMLRFPRRNSFPVPRASTIITKALAQEKLNTSVEGGVVYGVRGAFTNEYLVVFTDVFEKTKKTKGLFIVPPNMRGVYEVPVNLGHLKSAKNFVAQGSLYRDAHDSNKVAVAITDCLSYNDECLLDFRYPERMSPFQDIIAAGKGSPFTEFTIANSGKISGWKAGEAALLIHRLIPLQDIGSVGSTPWGRFHQEHGLVLAPLNRPYALHVNSEVLLWRPPHTLSFVFRLGESHDGTTFPLQCLDIEGTTTKFQTIPLEASTVTAPQNVTYQPCKLIEAVFTGTAWQPSTGHVDRTVPDFWSTIAACNLDKGNENLFTSFAEVQTMLKSLPAPKESATPSGVIGELMRHANAAQIVSGTSVKDIMRRPQSGRGGSAGAQGGSRGGANGGGGGGRRQKAPKSTSS